MKVYRSLDQIPAGFGPSVVTIGNFDGVHRGHLQIMHRVAAIGAEHSWTPCVLTFDPHPAQILAPAKAKRLLMSAEMRLEKIAKQGIEAVLLLPFSQEFAALSPSTFAATVLRDGLHAKRVLVGEDFRFGHKQVGNFETLTELGTQFGYQAEAVSAVLWRGERVSSTNIRKHLDAGEVSRACRLLGGAWEMRGPVVKGQGIGSKQTVPTLNILPGEGMIPKSGVYVTRTRDLGSARVWNSITNVGVRPTFDGQGLTVETFLLSSFDGETPHKIAVEFLRWVREERRFDTPEALKSQILRDVQIAVRLHRRLPSPE